MAYLAIQREGAVRQHGGMAPCARGHVDRVPWTAAPLPAYGEMAAATDDMLCFIDSLGADGACKPEQRGFVSDRCTSDDRCTADDVCADQTRIR